MRLRKLVLPLLALPIALGGCGMLGSSAGTPGAAASATPIAGGGDWLVVATGSATPSPVASPAASRPPVLPPVSFLPVHPGCAEDWTVNPPLIPIEVVPGAGRLTVTWPRQYDSDYRITAVKQPLITGNQPAYTWQQVPAGTGCTVTATITGLQKGVPYIVWLDAPNTGHELDGARHPYSGRSGVVYPR
ncbi:hypothetical protein [Actinoplanes auranticolor]|uniref:Fibronectin type-III domain-containing protein n=1 Tax=Actinoplanes auranticolor TaxID=47988 RepID=A0A919SLE4_9ACTN|nr:hypothetical protein [Actinoplanes auranticolor]GIM73088.1 hypothetical protein Aau02nite_54220 [Actinoplanes auranticolor]